MFGLSPESVFTFIPESRSASSRNRVHLYPGTAFTFARNTQKVHAEIDPRPYPPGIGVPDAEMAQINIRRDEFHGEWNYQILPRK